MKKMDPYFLKQVDFWYKDVAMKFRVSQSLFSSHQIDTGTQRLLKSLIDLPVQPGAKILDLGCGYGPIGLSLAKRFTNSQVHMVDRDALAVHFTQQNATLNGLDNCVIYGSLDYEDIHERAFDFIVSNIPGKAGDDVIAALLLDARYYLKPDGMVAVVVVSPLEDLVVSILDQPDIEVLNHSVFSGHIIFHYRFTTPMPGNFDIDRVETGLYQRASVGLSLDDMDFDIETAHGLPEFDSLDYQTDLLIKVLIAIAPQPAPYIMICNPGQGYIPVLLWRLLQPEKLTVLSRDLLSLRFTARNLQINGCPGSQVAIIHQVGWELSRSGDSASELNNLIVGILPDGDGPEISTLETGQAVNHLAKGGFLFAAGGSTPITRLIKNMQPDKRLVLTKRRKHQGKSVGVWQRR
ncbi:MAG: methyltransferase [Anaerolineae bacterium]|nr:methyltransferase [Anaerolineae bacterium]